MIRSALCAVAITVGGIALGAASPAAAADDDPSVSALSSYQQFSADWTAAPNAQTGIGMVCPAGTRVVGGGVLVIGSSLAVNLAGSYPDPLSKRRWNLFVNNATGSEVQFRAFAICVTGVRLYSIVAGTSVNVLAGTQATDTVSCPSGTVPLGGGGKSDSTSTSVNLNSSLPLTSGWRIDVNNGSAAEVHNITAYAVCGKQPAGYHQLTGATRTIQPGTQGFSRRVCTPDTVVLSGGVFVNSSSTAVNLNSTEPFNSDSWVSYVDNASPTAVTVSAYAVCAKASTV